MIDESFVEAIKTLAQEAEQPVQIRLPGNKLGIFHRGVLIERDGDWKNVDRRVEDFASLLEAIEFYGNLEPQPRLEVTVADDRICASFDPHVNAKCHFVTLELEKTRAHMAFNEWQAQPKPVSWINKAFRTSLHGSIEDSLVSVFKQVEFATGAVTSVTREAHRDTMGKSVDAAVKSKAGEMPECFHGSFRMFANVPCSHVRIPYFVDSRPENQTIAIVPVGDTYEEALQVTLVDLIDTLQAKFPAALVIKGK